MLLYVDKRKKSTRVAIKSARYYTSVMITWYDKQSIVIYAVMFTKKNDQTKVLAIDVIIDKSIAATFLI